LAGIAVVRSEMRKAGGASVEESRPLVAEGVSHRPSLTAVLALDEDCGDLTGRPCLRERELRASARSSLVHVLNPGKVIEVSSGARHEEPHWKRRGRVLPYCTIRMDERDVLWMMVRDLHLEQPGGQGCEGATN